MLFGIMQGRLVAPEGTLYQSFPRTAWAEEFPRALAAGLDAIEWIYDVYGEDMNPIANDAGLDRMRALTKEHGIQTASCCADWFMERPLVKGTEAERAERFDRLTWLLGQLGKLKMQRVVHVTVGGKALDQLNELECVDGSVWANVWQTDRIVRIDAKTGHVTAVVDAPNLLTPDERSRADVLNGIAWDPATKTFLITGKWWPKLFRVKFVA